MSVIAIVTNVDEARAVLTWSMMIARNRHRALTVFCWSASVAEFPLLASDEELAENDALSEVVEATLSEFEATESDTLSADAIDVHRAINPSLVEAILSEVRVAGHQLVIASAAALEKQSSTSRGVLLKRCPCETMLLHRLRAVPSHKRRIMLAASNSPHDRATLSIFGGVSSLHNVKLTLAQVEDESGDEATELGRRELKRLIRDAGFKSAGSVRRRVYTSGDWDSFRDDADGVDLLAIGAGQSELMEFFQRQTSRPSLATVHRAPPLQRLTKNPNSMWRTKLSPADYADMYQGLRRGSKLDLDFLVMLGLAAAIASLGLIQDSAAVVIGSMLLAPLMTPMIACGLAIAQANKKLGRRSTLSIAFGFLLTLAVSFVTGVTTPGEEITSQIMARGNPNILDLLIAIFSAAAAAYALARPNIAGAVAGVAIATALVPPLCSAGISLAYREYLNAQGAALLFATNLVAIVIGAAVTFRMLGVTSEQAGLAQRKWVFRVCSLAFVSLLLMAYPLQQGLHQLIDQGKTQPTTYPLTRVVDEALVRHIARTPDVHLVASGRPSSLHDRSDVVIFLSSPRPLPHEYANELIRICRREMGDDELIVDVHCLLDNWVQEEENAASETQERLATEGGKVNGAAEQTETQEASPATSQ